MKQRKKYSLQKRRLSLGGKDISGWILVIPTILLFLFIVWRPIYIGMKYSFYSLKGFTPVEFVGRKNFKDVLTDTNFMQTLKNTLLYVFWSLIVGLPLPFICAVIVNELWVGRTIFKTLSYLPCVIPAMAVYLIWKMIYLEGDGGLLNMLLYYLGQEPVKWLANKNIVILLIIITMSWSGFGSTMIMYLASLQGINRELYEAARIDGAGFWGRIRYVLFPHMRGIVLLMAIRQIISVFQITEQPMTMTGGGPNGASMSLGLQMYNYAFKFGQTDRSLAVGVIMFVILIGLTVVYFKLEKKYSD